MSDFYFEKIGDELALPTREAARYIGRSYVTFRNMLNAHPEIRRRRTGVGNKQYILKVDLDTLKDSIEKFPETADFKYTMINGREALNMSQAAGYLKMSYDGLRKRLMKHPEIKRVCRSDGKEAFLYKEDLDRLQEFHEE